MMFVNPPRVSVGPLGRNSRHVFFQQGIPTLVTKLPGYSHAAEPGPSLYIDFFCKMEVMVALSKTVLSGNVLVVVSNFNSGLKTILI